MEGIKYANLIEIGPVVIEIRGAENGELAVPVNNHGYGEYTMYDTTNSVLYVLLESIDLILLKLTRLV